VSSSSSSSIGKGGGDGDDDDAKMATLIPLCTGEGMYAHCTCDENLTVSTNYCMHKSRI